MIRTAGISSTRHPSAAAPFVRALVTQDLEGDRQKLARDRNARLVGSSDLQVLVSGAKLRIAGDGRCHRFHIFKS